MFFLMDPLSILNFNFLLFKGYFLGRKGYFLGRKGPTRNVCKITKSINDYNSL
jgi:hypothetical protein